MSNTRIWCSKCGVFRDSESFETNKSGRTKKLCNRHGKKRDLEVLYDDWDTFEEEVHSWNHPDQTHCLDLKRIFNIDSLPVGFASQLPVQPQDGSTDHSPLNKAINMLAEVIWRKGGFRFWHRRMKQENLTYVYFCSQEPIALTLRWRQDSATHDEWSGFCVTATLHSNRHSKIIH
ncbi:hypothetical protein POJ06DRAFT_31514 [Lipomyces tetrasporus]|uniref:Uncharacterized protein n=1 Tax=Lipomyces tetrasporus TaxID=54092 RepID=A0AAD7QLB1_9ASCO|nr:uncharacterized protein POJ06DRAFT_31514 [Lipomyces tetrasporus]KAJ8097430.1 hypothetical protein POJ06DRAFT_31514 [Lipomyces tetrasporus]